MSEAPPLSDRIAARLERLAELDLAAAEHVHAQLVATSEPAATADLARAYQRASRTARQTLMLQMRHMKACDEAQTRAARHAEAPVSAAEVAYDRLVTGRIEVLQDAVGRIAAATHPDKPRLQREALDRLDIELDDWVEDEAFLAGDLDDKIAEACERLCLPSDLARQWEDLPKPTQTFDPATALPPPVPTADTG
jgi:hypothetical protein